MHQSQAIAHLQVLHTLHTLCGLRAIETVTQALQLNIQQALANTIVQLRRLFKTASKLLDVCSRH